MTPPNTQSGRDHALEALRGIASVTVLAWHSIVAFFPERSGIYPGQDLTKAFLSRFWFGLVFGTSAVAFFFVLSGFVLTRRFFLTGDAAAIERNAIKRWPRLAIPVLVTVLLSWCAFRFGLYFHQPAAVITQSWWLWYFGNASQQPIVPDFGYAFRLGAYLTFIHGDNLYDSSLWTMRFEFIGSFIAMGLALLVQPMRSWALRAYLVFVCAAICHFVDPQYVAFPVGAALAAFLSRTTSNRHGILTAGMVALAIYLLGYAGAAVGDFRPVAWFLVPAAISPTYAHLVGSVLLIVAAETSPRLHSMLSGRWAVFLGRVSFPLYLVHVPIICSVGSAALVKLGPRLEKTHAALAAVAVTFVASFLAAYPLTVLNEKWLTLLNRIVAKLMPRGS